LRPSFRLRAGSDGVRGRAPASGARAGTVPRGAAGQRASSVRRLPGEAHRICGITWQPYRLRRAPTPAGQIRKVGWPVGRDGRWRTLIDWTPSPSSISYLATPTPGLGSPWTSLVPRRFPSRQVRELREKCRGKSGAKPAPSLGQKPCKAAGAGLSRAGGLSQAGPGRALGCSRPSPAFEFGRKNRSADPRHGLLDCVP